MEAVKRNILIWIGTVVILLGASVIYERHELKNNQSELQKLKNKYGKDVDQIIELNSQLVSTQTQILSLQAAQQKIEDIRKMEKTQVELQHYYQCVAEKIKGIYCAWNMKRTKEEAKVIDDIVPTVFKDVNLMYKTGRLANFGGTPRIISLRILSMYKTETNFDLDSINQNYVRDRPAKWVTMFTKEDKTLIEGRGFLWDGNYKKLPDGRIEFSFGEDGKTKAYAKPIGSIRKIIIDDKDEVEVTIDGVKQKVKATQHAIKTTKDWGGLQNNDVNLSYGYAELKRLGLWNEKMNKWTLDVDVNIWLRLVECDEAARLKWIDWTYPPWDSTMLYGLEQVSGWKGLME